MSEFFAEGGWTMFPTAFFGALSVLCAMLVAARPERRLVPLFITLNALTLMAGLVGTTWGVSGMVNAAANAEAAEVGNLMAACAAQAVSSLKLASTLVLLALMGAAAGALRVALGRVAPEAA